MAEKQPVVQVVQDQSSIYALNEVSAELGAARRDIHLKNFQIGQLTIYGQQLQKIIDRYKKEFGELSPEEDDEEEVDPEAPIGSADLKSVPSPKKPPPPNPGLPSHGRAPRKPRRAPVGK